MVVIIVLLFCSLGAFATLYMIAVKSNKILFYDKVDNKGTYPLVSAGSIDKNKREANVSIFGTEFNANEKRIDVEQYKKLLVDGWSMKKFGIRNGDIVFVNEQYKKEELSETTNSIIVFKVKPKGQNRIEYKLRKFIDFYDFSKYDDFKEWIEENHADLDKEKLMSKYGEKSTGEKKKECINSNSRLVLSETRRRGAWYHLRKSTYYSLHPESRIIGNVEHKIPREKIYILNKV